jgi:hypothetical protein
MAKPDNIATFKYVDGTGANVSVPVYNPSDLAYPALRVQTAEGTGAIPLAELSNADHPDVRVQTDKGALGMNNIISTTISVSANGSSFNSGSVQPFAVNLGGSRIIECTLNGGGGGTGEFPGENGGQIVATIDIGSGPSNRELYVYVGKKGESPSFDGTRGQGGFGAHFGGEGGFDADHPTGGGGGSSELRIGADGDANAVISAGGGRGGTADFSSGGDGGQHNGEGGQNPGTGLVIDSTKVLSSTITRGGGAGNRNNGSVSLTFYQ